MYEVKKHVHIFGLVASNIITGSIYRILIAIWLLWGYIWIFSAITLDPRIPV